MRKSCGFGALEVVIVLGILVLVGVSVVPRQRSVARRSACAANLNSQRMALSMIALQNNNNNNSSWPASNVEGGWLTDQSPDFSRKLLEVATNNISNPSARKVFYCPENALQDVEKQWAVGNVSIWGYAMLNARGPENKGMPALPARNPPLQYLNREDGPRPSETEVGFDVIVSASSDPAAPTGFSAVARKTGVPMTYGTSHLKGATPTGANVSFMDGHVEWREISGVQSAVIKQEDGAYLWLPGR